MKERPVLIEMVDLVSTVRSALEQAELKRKEQDKDPLFELEELVLELNVVVSQSDTANGKIALGLVGFGADLNSKTEQIHKVILRFATSQKARGGQVLGARHAQDDPKPPDKTHVDPL
jgi:hypothetical protein